MEKIMMCEKRGTEIKITVKSGKNFYGDAVEIECCIGGKNISCSGLSDEKQTLIFRNPQNLSSDGKKYGGIMLPNYAEVKAAYDEVAAHIKQQARQKREEILTGTRSISVQKHDNDGMPYYTVCGIEEDLLMDIGAAKEKSIGCVVDVEVVNAYGTTFTYPQVLEFVKPKIDAKKDNEVREAAERQCKFDEAKLTGKPVVLRTWMSECHSRDIDCDYDANAEYAMPDGTTKITWVHCH